MSDDSLQTSFWVMVLVQTIGSVDMPGSGARKMPSPRQYVAIVVTWIVLMLIAGISDNAAKATRAIGWVLVLVGMVVGPFGRRTVNLFNTVATNFRTTPPPATTNGSGAASSIPGIGSVLSGAASAGGNP